MGKLITIRVLLKCTLCPSKQTIRRKKSLQKKKRHVKSLYCVGCGKRTPHTEMGVE